MWEYYIVSREPKIKIKKIVSCAVVLTSYKEHITLYITHVKLKEVFIRDDGKFNVMFNLMKASKNETIILLFSTPYL